MNLNNYIRPDEGIVTIKEDGKVYYMGFLMGKISYDYYTFILFRKSWQRVRRHDAYGCSRIFLEKLYQLGCRMFIISIDDVPKFKIPTIEMIRKGIYDKLEPEQSVHVFMPIKKLEEIT